MNKRQSKIKRPVIRRIEDYVSFANTDVEMLMVDARSEVEKYSAARRGKMLGKAHNSYLIPATPELDRLSRLLLKPSLRPGEVLVPVEPLETRDEVFLNTICCFHTWLRGKLNGFINRTNETLSELEEDQYLQKRIWLPGERIHFFDLADDQVHQAMRVFGDTIYDLERSRFCLCSVRNSDCRNYIFKARHDTYACVDCRPRANIENTKKNKKAHPAEYKAKQDRRNQDVKQDIPRAPRGRPRKITITSTPRTDRRE